MAAATIAAPAGLRSDCSLTSVGITPFADAGPRFYKNSQCGLYPRGGNARPPAHDAAAMAMAAQIQPLDANGAPDPAAGRVVMISIGMSNTSQEFASGSSMAFKPRADADPSKNPRLVIVNGAQGGQKATSWVSPTAPTWDTVDSRLAGAGVTPQQVQVAWLKHARARPNDLGAFPAHAQALASDLAAIARSARTRYPNLKLLYLSSRTRAYTDVATSLNPEPFAFESAFAVKWVIEDQITGHNNLNWDPARGPVVAPLMLWGAYLWADGTTPRSDGLTWLCSDLQNDFTHPSPAGGVVKVASQLLAFFKTDATATPWFLRNVATGQPPVLTANANVTTGNVPLNVSFSAAATDPDGTIVTYQWTFGDGTFSRTQDAAKVFRAPGTYEVRVTATDNSGNTAQQTIPVTVKLSLPEWRPIYFTAAELQDPEISGDAADPDRDAATNLAEYALGSHPKIADLPVFAARASGGQLILTYPQAKYAADVTIAVEVSSGPSGPWQSGPNATSQQVVGDDGIVQTVEATDLATASARRFMRLRIDRIPAPRSR